MNGERKLNNIKTETDEMKTKLKGKLIKIPFPQHIQNKCYPENDSKCKLLSYGYKPDKFIKVLRYILKCYILYSNDLPYIYKKKILKNPNKEKGFNFTE